MRSTATALSKSKAYGLSNLLAGALILSIALWIFSEIEFWQGYQVNINNWQWWNSYVKDSSIQRWLLFIVATIFFLSGAIIFQRGYFELQTKRQRRSRFRRSPESPWIWDRTWPKQQPIERNNSHWDSTVVAAIFVIGVHIITWTLAARENFEGMILIFAIGVTVLTLLLVAIAILILRRESHHHQVKVHTNTFPLRLGEDIEIELSGLKAHPLSTLEIELSAIREYNLTSGQGTRVECQIVHRQSTILEAIDQDHYTVKFKLPDDPTLSSRTSARPATFWELHLYAIADEANLDKRFLLPIY